MVHVTATRIHLPDVQNNQSDPDGLPKQSRASGATTLLSPSPNKDRWGCWRPCRGTTGLLMHCKK